MTSPASIQSWLDQTSYKMDLSCQYLGDEPNTLNRDWDSSTLRWLMCASWPYEHAAGNQSIPYVAKAVTDASPRYLCDRFYLPATPRDMRLLERGGIPCFGIESKHEVLDFDVVGTSISYLVLLMNFAKMLTMSGIPLRWREREDDPGAYPMVIIGGQAFSAPAAMEPIADCIWLGEADTEPGNGGMAAVCRRIEEFKAAGSWRQDRIGCYRELALEFGYLHFPRFVQTHYRYEDRGLPQPSKVVAGYESLLPGMTFPRRSRRVRDMNAISPLTAAPLLYSDPALGAGDMEVARGCPAWCSFCRLSWLTKPYRQRDVALSVEHAAQWHRAMGAVELSPFAPDFPMHTQRQLLIKQLLEQVNDEADAVAMRIDDAIADKGVYIQLQALGGMDAITLGLEGNSQRMRDLVGKGTSDNEVVEAVRQGIQAGLRKFKLFMITNLPGEEKGDVLRIVRLGEQLAAVRDELGQPNVQIQFSWTPLLIEMGTPFQWFAVTHADHTLIKIAEFFRDLKIAFKIGTKAEPNKVAFFQLCQRASAEVGEAIVDVMEEMNIACWGGVPRGDPGKRNGMKDRLEDALITHGFLNGFDDCFDERRLPDLFGAEYIDTGVPRQLLWSTYRQMVEFLEQTDADTYDDLLDPAYRGNEWVGRCDTSCQGKSCGVCSRSDLELRRDYITAAKSELSTGLSGVRPLDQSSVVMRVRLRLVRREKYRFVGNDHWRFAVRRAAYQAAYAMANTLPGGFSIAKRTIHFASDRFGSQGLAGTDYVEFGITRELDDGQLYAFVAGMSAYLDRWVSVIEESRTQLPPVAGELRKDADVSFCSMTLAASPDVAAARLAAWGRAETVPMILRHPGVYFGLATEEVDAREFVDDMWVAATGNKLELKMFIRGEPGPYQLMSTLMGKKSWIEAMAHPVWRHDFFLPGSTGLAALQGDSLRLACMECGLPVPYGADGQPWLRAALSDPLDICPRCLDERHGRVLAGLPRLAAV
jgi:radical SAM superfamily enzyme YgiQ (UPF0313 family)